ncbi:sialic acid-binding Ig-like lectin 10 isoform X1 [Alosa sapidissima]|uniref:sialic acid-binding Ig-like lectin 10 isoform X1 n=1 Tax=Alosa sapidissima TaxID=34773 RepID=UPI001C08571A|nr:sialic acid-binding Ig-like lectin 10 isoform X1 [Alosa sapidissima]
MVMALKELICFFFSLVVVCGPRGVRALTLVVPARVSALAGSCVLIPCSLSPPQRQGRPVEVEVRLQYHWSTPMGALFPTVPRLALSSSSGEDDDASSLRVHKDFRGRVALTGDVSKGDCSVTVSEVRQKDASNYVLEMRRRGDKNWSKMAFQMDVSNFPELPRLTGPESVTDGQQVVLNCTVGFPCPSQPPTLRWRWVRGRPDNSSVFGEPRVALSPDKRPLLWASLSFTASYHLMPRISCEVHYQKLGAPVVMAKDIHVKFPPKDVHIRLHTSAVREGGSALLECSCKADPPVEEYDWSYTQHGRTRFLPLHTFTVRIGNVTRHTRVICTAKSRLGSTASPSTAINVEYKPHILSKSSCRWDGTAVYCRCIADSNPRAAITWSVNGSPPSHGYNTSVFVHSNGTVAARLGGVVDMPPSVVCYANNAHGNDSRPLLQEVEVSLLWLLMAALGMAFSVLVIVAAVFLCCGRRQAGRRSAMINHRSQAVYPGDVGIYQEHAPLYINCTEVTHIYTNGSYQLVYQNCTPCFVRTKQTHKRRRRGAWRDGVQREAERLRAPPGVSTAETDTAIYLEVL